MELQDRIDVADTLHRSGQNCAQCVLQAFDDITGLEPAVASAVTACMGRGLCGNGLTCGALLGAMAVLGTRTGGSLDVKKKAMQRGAAFVSEFKNANGAVQCAELRVPGGKPCHEIILDTVRDLHNYIAADEV